MKIIIAGSRNLYGIDLIEEAIKKSEFEVTEIVSGTARGIDTSAITYSKLNKIPVKEFPARWNIYGKRAGYIRNEFMADYSEALIAIWDGESKGTFHMINIATKAGLKVYIHKVESKL